MQSRRTYPILPDLQHGYEVNFLCRAAGFMLFLSFCSAFGGGLRDAGGKADDLTLGLANIDFAHSVKGIPLWHQDLRALHAISGLGEIIDLYIQAGSHGKHSLASRFSVFFYAYASLKHDLRVAFFEDDESELVALRDLGDLLKLEAAHPKLERGLNGIDKQDWCDLHTAIVFLLAGKGLEKPVTVRGRRIRRECSR